MNFSKPILYCVSVLSVASVAEGTIVGQYDFNSNFDSNFSLLFGSGVTFTDNAGNGVMTDGVDSDEEEAAYIWDGQSLNAGQSWILSIDSTVSTDFLDLISGAGSDTFGSLGIVVRSNQALFTTSHLTFQAWGDQDGNRGFDSSADGVFQEDVRSLTETTLLRITYDADTKILSALEPDDSVLRSINVATSWGMVDSDTFAFGVMGTTEGGEIPTDQAYVWLDNLKLETVPEPSSVMMLGVSGFLFCIRRKR